MITCTFSKCLAFCGLGLCLVGSASAAEHKGPNFYTHLTLGALNVSDRDLDPWAFEATTGIKGQYHLDNGIRFIYELEAEAAGAVNDSDEQTWSLGEYDADAKDEIYISKARMTAVTDYGAFIVAPRLISGQWVWLYDNVDRFVYNRFFNQTGKIAIFGQSYQAQDILAYGSPEIVKGLRLQMATGHQNDLNGKEADVHGIRLVYRADGVRAGIGHIRVSSELLPTDEDYGRTTLSAGVDIGNLALDAVYEINKDSVVPPRPGQSPTTGGFDSFVITGAYEFLPTWTATLGLAQKDHDEDRLDVDGVIAQVKKHLDENVYLFAETGQYDNAPDNVAAGVSFSF
ncbi:porin [Halomonas sp. LR5S13]|uniref:porin n=1 Tax=Halomonas rhizosphaerae TaxID=3043296 RepID=UPI0024A9DAEC|nr:porin [Halomonas rhizosphaerae]MDI5922675.1 porin [Halomonas rhizosphaerae]